MRHFEQVLCKAITVITTMKFVCVFVLLFVVTLGDSMAEEDSKHHLRLRLGPNKELVLQRDVGELEGEEEEEVGLLACAEETRTSFFKTLTEVEGHTITKRCKCTCRRKWNPRATWECCPCPWTYEICFPGDATLTTAAGSDIPMKNLEAGTRVKTVSEEGKVIYTEVKTFLKRQPSKNAVYLSISTNTGANLTLSGRHLVFVSSNNNTANMEPRFALSVKLGEYLFTTGNCGGPLCPSLVTHIEPVVKEGVYVPLTEEGTLIVNDVYASCYSSINHHIAHAFTTPFRWFPWLLSAWQENGYSPIVDWMKQFGHVILSSESQFQNQEISALPKIRIEL